jgi:putative transposase
MPNYRRVFIPGATYFFTVVTNQRIPLFRDPQAVRELGRSFRLVRSRLPFKPVAMVLLHDHLHCIWSMAEGDTAYPRRWQWIKREFSERWSRLGGIEGPRSSARIRKGDRGFWQRGYWEHRVRDEEELICLTDYIHFNPVNHGYVAKPAEWPWSTFAAFVRAGDYPPEWGNQAPRLPRVEVGE